MTALALESRVPPRWLCLWLVMLVLALVLALALALVCVELGGGWRFAVLGLSAFRPISCAHDQRQRQSRHACVRRVVWLMCMLPPLISDALKSQTRMSPKRST